MFSKVLHSAFLRFFLHHSALSVSSRLKSQHIRVLFRPPDTSQDEETTAVGSSRQVSSHPHTFPHILCSFSSPQQPMCHLREGKKKTEIQQNPVSRAAFQSTRGLNYSAVTFSAFSLGEPGAEPIRYTSPQDVWKRR